MGRLELLNVIDNSPYFQAKLAGLKSPNKINFSGLIGSSKAAIIASLADQLENLFIITASTREAEKLKKEVDLFSGREAQIFPALDILPEEDIRPDKEIIGQRLNLINRLAEENNLIVIAPLKAVMLMTSSKKQIKSSKVKIQNKAKYDLSELIEKLINLGYKRFDIVGERGEFSVRGGIIDIFPLNHDFPVRMELIGDQIESLRTFDPYDQRSIKKIEEVTILSVSESFDTPIFEYLSENTTIILDEIMELTRSAESLKEESPLYLDFSLVKAHSKIELSWFLAESESEIFSPAPSYINQFENIAKRSIVISRHAERLKEGLPELQIIQGELRGGFIFEGSEVLSDRELFGEEISPRPAKPAGREGVADELLSDLKVGDYVVHENYGIGLYQGMQALEIDEVKQEYLLIEYAGADKLYVPPHMIGLVEKYSGGGDAKPRLSRLGTQEWLRTRGRVKQSLRDMTQELLEIYAAREKLEGQAFPPDDIWQKELEATFPYDETPDQLKAIVAVKKDMESPRPMDRLVCGDVGYGKTEVAIRAAAKAASAGKQVAILAPTTILVEQHYNNFKQRFKNLPFNVEMLSRFRSQKEQKQVIKMLENGGIDIVIGTHRLLSKDVKFKDLGLLVVDEEQKFGVTHKEKIKKFKKTIDVLTLTATPIPRTLYFSLSGIREMSMIATAPVDRSPIRTYVLPYSEAVIREAAAREIDRGGQVYFLHNFVDTIQGVAARLKKLLPQARVAVAHGQMEEKQLEKVMLEFLDKKCDVLVCTSIIESGLDIPSVNTILIDRADRLGLSQLYQIRGRVGRSAVRAYAYLFYLPSRNMTDQAVERLKAIQEFTALGSGYKLAMRDLEIRGSGNLLGAEQSGHIYEVGFDLYVELLEEAVQEVKGTPVVSPREITLDLKVEAYIPEAYISDERQRIAIYRRMNYIQSREQLDELKKELLDRFGKIPEKMNPLFDLLLLKARALRAGVKSIRQKDGEVMVEWSSGKKKTVARKDLFKLF